METNKWQTWAACGPGQSPVCSGIGYTPTQSVTQSAAASAVCDLWRYISDGPLPLYSTLETLRRKHQPVRCCAQQVCAKSEEWNLACTALDRLTLVQVVLTHLQF